MILNINDFILEDNDGKFIIIKASERDALANMKKGEFWFRHPAFYNLQENQDGNETVGDKYDNKLDSIYTGKTHLQKGSIKLNGIISGENLDCVATIQTFIYKAQDCERQISFYKLRIDESGTYTLDFLNLACFGYQYFALINISAFITESNLNDVQIMQEDCEYGDINTHNGQCGAFYKRDNYKYQNEFRVILSSEHYKVQLHSNSNFKDVLEKNRKCINISCNPNSLAAERLRAAKTHEVLESKLEQFRASLIDKRKLSNNLVSDIIDISQLTNKTNIYEWEG